MNDFKPKYLRFRFHPVPRRSPGLCPLQRMPVIGWFVREDLVNFGG
jgi:hypothetical protein